MTQKTFRLVRHIFPRRARYALRRLGLMTWMDSTPWRLPHPLAGLRMKGPGVFGTYIERPYEPEVSSALVNLIQPGWICVDIGAHIGYFTLLLAHLVGEGGHVFAFEALPENARWLRENVAINGFTARVTVENMAVTDGQTSTIRLHAPPHYTTEWSIVRPSSDRRSVEIRATCLDEYFAHRPKVDFIKMDVEGAEYLALQGGRTVLYRDRPLCLIELHGEEGQLAAQFLMELRYQIEDLRGSPSMGLPFPRYILARAKAA